MKNNRMDQSPPQMMRFTQYGINSAIPGELKATEMRPPRGSHDPVRFGVQACPPDSGRTDLAPLETMDGPRMLFGKRPLSDNLLVSFLFSTGRILLFGVGDRWHLLIPERMYTRLSLLASMSSQHIVCRDRSLQTFRCSIRVIYRAE